MKKRSVVLATLLFSAVAFAIAERSFDRYAQTKAALFIKGLYVGPDVGSNKVQSDTLNKVTAIRRGYVAWDFPALSGTDGLGGLECDETATTTVTGAKITDTCIPSSDLGVDGGDALNRDATLSCRAVTNGCIVKLCGPHATDAGVNNYNLHDAGFYCTLLSFQAQ